MAIRYAIGMAITLPPLYYLTHFRTVLEWVSSRYGDLLSSAEIAFLRDFDELSQDSQALCVRMLLRKPRHLRWHTLRYAEIGDHEAALAALITLGWVDDDPYLDIDDVTQLARRNDLLAAPWARPLPKSSRKQDLIAVMQADAEADGHRQRRWQDWLPGNTVRIVSFTHTAIIERIKLLFFGNLYQDWSEFVLTDLGQQQYEPVPIDAHARAFHHRDDVDHAQQLHAIGQRIIDADDLAALLDNLIEMANTLPPFLESRRQKRLFQLGNAAEKQHQWPLAERAYQATQHPGTGFRHVRVLERLERPDAAYDLACRALNGELPDSEQAALRRALPRLARRAQQPLPASPRQPSLPEDTLVLDAAPQQAIEIAACHALSQPHQPVHYVENTLLCGLFGLLFWEVIYAPLPGAFFNPFQRGPADLYQADFGQRRQSLIANVWQAMERGEHDALIQQRWQQKYSVQNPFVVWPALSETLLQQALTVIPAPHLRLIFSRMLADVRQHTRGLPDLIAIDLNAARYRLIEIKGPGDRLQDHQISWFHFFSRHQIPATVCHVRWEQP